MDGVALGFTDLLNLRTITIQFVGAHNAGKSTLINALLSAEYVYVYIYVCVCALKLLMCVHDAINRISSIYQLSEVERYQLTSCFSLLCRSSMYFLGLEPHKEISACFLLCVSIQKLITCGLLTFFVPFKNTHNLLQIQAKIFHSVKF